MFSGEGMARFANRFLLSQQSGYRFIRHACALGCFWCLETLEEQPEGE